MPDKNGFYHLQKRRMLQRHFKPSFEALSVLFAWELWQTKSVPFNSRFPDFKVSFQLRCGARSMILKQLENPTVSGNRGVPGGGWDCLVRFVFD